MKTNEIIELEKSLKSHRKQLEILLKTDDINESDAYLFIAGQLRVLLCDANIPILLKYAEEKGINLKIWGPNDLPDELKEGLALMLRTKVAGWNNFRGSRLLTIEEFLEIPIGYQITLNSKKSSAYSPKQIIKCVADKEGVAHLDFDKPAYFRALKEWKTHSNGKTIDDGLIRDIVLQIGEWTIEAIDEVLNPTGDISIVIRSRIKEFPKQPIKFISFIDDHNGVVINYSASYIGFEFEIKKKGEIIENHIVNYPDNWKIDPNLIFVFSYSSLSKQIELNLNGNSIKLLNYDLGIIKSEKIKGKPFNGTEKYFTSTVSLLTRILKVEEIHQILSLPIDWVESLQNDKNK